MLMVDGPALDADALRSQMRRDRSSRPATRSWDVARQAWNLAVDQRPALVAIPERRGRRRRRRRLRPRARPARRARRAPATTPRRSARSSARSCSRPPPCATSRSTPSAASPACSAGALWAEVTGPASEHGLAPLAGSSPDVGVVGYTLGGGLSWLARRHGLACNSVVSIEVVTADGRRLRADRDHEPDLFWALRGGTGSFAIVTAMEIALYALPERLRRRAAVAVGARRRGPAPLGRVVPHRARDDHHLGAPAPGPAAARHPRAAARPLVRGHRRRVRRRRGLRRGRAAPAARARARDRHVRRRCPPRGLSHIHMDPEQPVPGIGGHMLLDEPVRRGHRHARRRRRPGLGLAAAERRAAPPRRRARAAAPTSTARWPRSTPSFLLFAVGDPDGRRRRRGDRHPPRPRDDRDAAVGHRAGASSTSPRSRSTSARAYPERDAAAAARGQGGLRPARTGSPPTTPSWSAEAAQAGGGARGPGARTPSAIVSRSPGQETAREGGTARGRVLESSEVSCARLCVHEVPRMAIGRAVSRPSVALAARR